MMGIKVGTQTKSMILTCLFGTVYITSDSTMSFDLIFYMFILGSPCYYLQIKELWDLCFVLFSVLKWSHCKESGILLFVHIYVTIILLHLQEKKSFYKAGCREGCLRQEIIHWINEGTTQINTLLSKGNFVLLNNRYKLIKHFFYVNLTVSIVSYIMVFKGW